MRTTKYFLLLLSSVILFALLIPFGGYLYGIGGHPIKASLALIMYAALTYYWLQQGGSMPWRIWVGLLMLLPIILLYLPIYIQDFEGSQLSLPSSIAHGLGIGFGYLLAVANRPTKLILALLVLGVSYWTSDQGYDLWLHKMNYGTYLGQTDEVLPSGSFRDQQGAAVDITRWKGQFIVLDFWNTGCGICFKKFPLLEQYHQRYSPETKTKFFAVNIPLKRDKPNDAQQAIGRKNYSFPVLYAKDDSLASLFGIRSYPTVIVIDPSQRIVYRGELEGIRSLLE